MIAKLRTRVLRGRFSVRVRLAAIVLLFVVSICALGLLAVTSLEGQDRSVRELLQASRLQKHQQDADMQHDAIRGHVLAALFSAGEDGAVRERLRVDLEADAERLFDNLQALGQGAKSRELLASLERVRLLAEPYVALAREIVAEATDQPERAKARIGELEDSFHAMLAALDQQTRITDADIRRAYERAVDEGGAAKSRIASVVAGLSILAVGIVGLLARSIRTTLREVRDVAAAMARGDLSVRNHLDSEDELGELADAIDHMAGNLQEMIGRLRADADRDAFGTQLIEALEMVDTEREVHECVGRAMRSIAPDRPMELLLADSSHAHLERAAEHPLVGAPGCSVESPFSCIAVRRGNAVRFDDSDALNACPRLRGRPEGAVSAVCVPVGFMGRSLGVLHATGPVGVPPSAEKLGQLSTLGIQTGARIGTVRAFERTQIQASTDSLTGLANRRSLEEGVRSLVSSRKDFAVVLCDLDHFKKLNDTYGHAAGDSALRVFADAVRAIVRREDLPARWGGEEFALVVPGATAAETLTLVERLRNHLGSAIRTAGVRPFTASFGIADTSMSRQFDVLVRIADEALYRSKEGGRDRATIGDPEHGHSSQRHDTEHAAKIQLPMIAEPV